MMSRACRQFGSALAAMLAACGQQDRPPPDRPIHPTLTVAPDPGAPTTGRRIVAVGQIAQPWHTGAWSPASITLPEVAAGDAIVVVGAYWGDLSGGSRNVPTDTSGALRCAVNQAPATIGRKKPPVYAQLCVELDAAPGPHTIVPPYLGGQAGDGALYVLQVRGLTEHRLVGSGQTWRKGTALPGTSVELDGAAAEGDLVIALAGYDNTEPRSDAGFRPPAGWLPLGVQSDAANNVPSQLCYRIAPAAGRERAEWTWTDPTANVAVAAIAALR